MADDRVPTAAAPLHGGSGRRRGRDDARRALLGRRRAHAGRRHRGRRARGADVGAALVEDPAAARRDVARRVAGARVQGADVVGQPPDPRRGADLEQGDGLDHGRRRSRSSPRSSSCCPRSRRTASATSSASTGSGSTWPRVPCASASSSVTSSLIGADPRHQARVPVPRRRAQGDRRLRERRRAHRGGRAAVQHRSTCAAAPTSCSR